MGIHNACFNVTPKYKTPLNPVVERFTDGKACCTAYDYFTNPETSVKDMFGNEIKIGDYIVSTSSADGIHFATIGWPCKVIGFRKFVYWYNKVEYHALCARRYPIEDRGQPFVESVTSSMKTTKRNYLVCQKWMLQSDKESRENNSHVVTQSNRLGDARVFSSGNRAGVLDWMRPHVPYAYMNTKGERIKNHPQTRRRKARKTRRFVSEADAEAMYEKYFDEHREEFE